MRFSDPDLENVTELIAEHTEGQLYSAIRYLLRTEEYWATICNRNSLTAENSRDQDAISLKNWFWGYDVYTGRLMWRDTDAHKVVNGALMFIAYIAHKLIPERVDEAFKKAKAARTGKLYWTVRSLLVESEKADAICNQSWLRLTSDGSLSREQETISARFGFSFSKRSPEKYVQAALLLLGFHYYKLVKAQRMKGRPLNSGEPSSEESMPIPPEPVPGKSPATEVALVLRTSKFSEILADGEQLAAEVVARWLLDATFYTCRQPAQIDELEDRLKLLERPRLGGEEDVYVRLSMPPESGLAGKINKFRLLQTLRAVEPRTIQLVKLRRLDTCSSGIAMLEFQMS